MNRPTETDKILGDLEKLRGIYEQMVELSRRQGDVLVAGDLDQIFELAREKESKLLEASGVENEIAPWREGWLEERDVVSGDFRARVEQAFDDLRRLLSEILALESESETRLRSRHEKPGEAIRRIAQGRQVQKAYGAPDALPRRVDRTE